MYTKLDLDAIKIAIAGHVPPWADTVAVYEPATHPGWIEVRVSHSELSRYVTVDSASATDHDAAVKVICYSLDAMPRQWTEPPDLMAMVHPLELFCLEVGMRYTVVGIDRCSNKVRLAPEGFEDE